MTDRNYDFQGWLEPYTYTFASFAKAQQDGFRTLERFARLQYAVAGDLLDAGLAHARSALDTHASVGTQAIADGASSARSSARNAARSSARSSRPARRGSRRAPSRRRSQ